MTGKCLDRIGKELEVFLNMKEVRELVGGRSGAWLRRKRDGLSKEWREGLLRLIEEMEGRIGGDLKVLEDLVWPRRV